MSYQSAWDSVFFLSGNQGKLNEFRGILAGLKVTSDDVELPEIQSLSSEEVVREKILAAKDKCGPALRAFPLVVEDTGLSFGEEGAFPGALIKFAMKNKSMEQVAKMAHALHGPDCAGYATCAVALLLPDQAEPIFFTATIPGKIVMPRGKDGFGWDPIFQPDGSDKTFAEMSQEEKAQYSPRGRAVAMLAKALNATA